MKSLILAAALAVTAFVGIASAQSYCTTRCTPTYGGGYNCTQSCF